MEKFKQPESRDFRETLAQQSLVAVVRRINQVKDWQKNQALLVPTLTWGHKVFCTSVGHMVTGWQSFQDALICESLEVVTKSIAAVLTWATIKLKGKKNVMADRIIKAGMIKQVLCEEVVSPLPACFMGKGIYTWPQGTRPPT